MTVATITVYDLLADSHGNPLANWPVKITLNYAQASSVTPVAQIAAQESIVTTDSTGKWTVQLIANDNINPSGTLYVVKADTFQPYLINVTSTSVPVGGWQSSAITVNAPAGMGVTGFAIPGGTAVQGSLPIKGPDPWVDVTHPDFACVDSGNAADAAINDAGFAAAIATLPNGGTLLIPRRNTGIYDISNPVLFQNLQAIRVMTTGRSGQGFGVALRWQGANSGTAVTVFGVRDSSFEGLTVLPGGGTLAVGFDIDRSASNAVVSTGNRFISLVASTCTTAGFRLSATATANNELHKFDQCQAVSCGDGWQINNAQSKWHRLMDCYMVTCTNGINQINGSFTLDHPNFSGNAVDILLGSIDDSIQVYSPQSESAGRFLDIPTGAGPAWAVTVIGGRLDPNAVNVDNNFVRNAKTGPLTFLGCDFASGVNHAAVRFLINNSAGIFTSRGCVYPNATPFSFQNARLVDVVGNQYVQGGGAAAALPNLISAFQGFASTGMLDTYQIDGLVDLAIAGLTAPVQASSRLGDKLSFFQDIAADAVGIGSQGNGMVLFNTANAVAGARISVRLANTGGMRSTGTEVAAITMQGGVIPGQLAGAGTGSSSAIYSGTGAPANANGNNGDYYFRTDGAAAGTHIYFRAAGAWAGLTAATL